MSLVRAFAVPALAGAQLGAGIGGRNASYDLADELIRAGEDRVQERVRQGVLRRGDIRSARAASGVDVNAGSSYEVLVNDAVRTAMDVQRIRFQFGTRAARAKAEGDATLISGIAGGAASLINGAEGLFDMPFDFDDELVTTTGPLGSNFDDSAFEIGRERVG